MHSRPHGRLLEQLGSLYGNGTLSEKRGRFIFATLADQIDDCGGAARLDQIRQGPARIPAADQPISDTVLADPQNDAVLEITARRRFRASADNT